MTDVCQVCQDPLDPVMASLGVLSHPRCSITGVPGEQANLASVNPFTDPGDSPFPEEAADLKAEFMTMIRWHEEFSPRSMQVAVGPSDLGTECQRRLAYKVAGMAGYHRPDPWAAFVGSAIHTRIEDVVARYAKEFNEEWLIEGRIRIDANISGKADLVRKNKVIDIKSASPEVIRELPVKGPREAYKTQVQLYAKGLNDNGHEITRVAFIFVPRSGKLDDTYTWVDEYRPDVAQAALDRVYKLANWLHRSLDITHHPGRWELVPATPEFMSCYFCPLFNEHMGPNDPATDKGCAGWKMNKERR